MGKEIEKVRKGILIGCMISAALLLGFLGSYAYFISAGNNNQNQSEKVQTGNMTLTFSDGNNGINEALNFGESIIKTFTIENTGTLNAFAKIDWENFINTYIYSSLTYKLEYSLEEDGTYTEIVSNLEMPKSENETSINLVNALNIPAQTKYYYKLTITLNYLEDIDQTEDLNAILSTKFNLKEGTEKIELTLDTNGVDVEVENKLLNLNTAYGDLPILSKEGYIFKGWYTSENIEITKETIITQPVNTTIYAKWEERFNIVEAINAMKNNQKPKGVNSEVPDFSKAATTDEGVFSMEDDYGTSYYYRGAVTNNYIKFGGFYWRIIRINGDGSLRMIYDGTSAHANGTSNANRLALTKVAWNAQYNDAKYVGYMYGGTNGTTVSKEQAQTNEVNTNIKTQLENWYKTNIRDKGLDEYVADSIYCNDRSTPGKSENGWTNDTELGYGRNVTGYGALSRFMTGNNSTSLSARTDPSPTFVCSNKNDAFTKEDEERGNGALGEKVGLITADEIVAGGSGKYHTQNTNYYLYKGNLYWYWSLSPYCFGGSYSGVFRVYTGGYLDGTDVTGAGGVAPVTSV